jgi:hypothetical protein
VARVLEGCGLDLGGAAHFAPPAPGNRDGYWEDLRFVALNDRILDRMGGAWDVPPALPDGWEESPVLEDERRVAPELVSGRVDPWGWKDPRSSLTVRFWKRLLPGMKVVVCVRNPLEVADSLRARGYTSERFGLALWEAYHRTLERDVDASFALVTHYHSLLADPRAELARLLEFTGLRPSPAVQDAVVAGASTAARHQRRSSAEVGTSALSPAGKRLYASLCERSGPVYAEALRREADAARHAGRRGAAAFRSRQLQAARDLEAREGRLASIKPVLIARRKRGGLGRKGAGRARRGLRSVKPLLAAREGERQRRYIASLGPRWAKPAQPGRPPASSAPTAASRAPAPPRSSADSPGPRGPLAGKKARSPVLNYLLRSGTAVDVRSLDHDRAKYPDPETAACTSRPALGVRSLRHRGRLDRVGLAICGRGPPAGPAPRPASPCRDRTARRATPA